jgi:hypothetical protein
MMTIPEILKKLEPYTGRFPMEATKSAVEQREAITPQLPRVVEAVADNPAEFARRQDCTCPRAVVWRTSRSGVAYSGRSSTSRITDSTNRTGSRAQAHRMIFASFRIKPAFSTW